MAPLPAAKSADDIFATLEGFAGRDADWRSGRTFAYVYDPGADVEDVAKRAYMRFLTENALAPGAFPSLVRLENEVVGFALNHLNAPEGASGSFTTGGTESCLLAVKTARDYARAAKPHITRPELILPTTAHAAFHKAAHYFGLKKVLVDVDPVTFRADPAAIEAAITPNTIQIVASAVSYAYGVLDPVAEIAAIAQKHDLLFHVDGCIGGFLLPYIERITGVAKPFDFRVPGVTSMSMDWHKYGYCPKAASVVLHRSAELRRFQFFACAEYEGYAIVNPTILSAKSGGPLAAAWAVINYLGDEGYLRFVRRIHEATQKVMAGIQAIPGLQLLAPTDTNQIAFRAEGFPCFHLVAAMKAKDWLIQPQFGAAKNRDNIHLSIGQSNLEHVDAFLADLAACTAALQGTKVSDAVLAVRAAAAGLGAADMTQATLLRLLDIGGVGPGKKPSSAAEMDLILDALPPKLTEMALTDAFSRLFTPRR